MRVGVVILPDTRWPEAARRWERAEALGFDHAWTYDHLGWGDYVDGPWFGAVPTLAAAAQRTATLPLGLLVATPNFRHPVAFAREVLALDDIAGGRFVLGLGAGDDGYDARVLGEPPLSARARFDRFAEFVDALDGALTADGFDFDGRLYAARGSRNLPGLRRPPRYVIAANGPRGMRLAAHHAWVTAGRPADTQRAWWDGVTELARRFDAPVPRYLNADAAPLSPLISVTAFEDTAGRAAELGFTDLIVRWADDDEGVLKAIAQNRSPRDS
jgi:alkanesulfonate monooxygenase SsuD/methylene tetrahydromethanopterin reductase-like flavin-dependent oxidoreductase (luciferase family)